MGRKRYRRRTAAATIIGGTIKAANRTSWKRCVVLGIATFFFFYFALPNISEHIASNHGPTSSHTVIEHFANRQIRLFRLIGVAGALACGFFAIRNYWTRTKLDDRSNKVVSLIARLVARMLN